MREGKRNSNWFAVDSKSFEFTAAGEGKKIKIFITEKSRDLVSWIRFGEEGLKNLLKGVEACCRDSSSTRRSSDWKESGRSYRLDCKENHAGRYLLIRPMLKARGTG